MRRPGDTSDDPPGGRAAERLREHLRDRFGSDPENLPEAIRPDAGDDVEEPGDTGGSAAPDEDAPEH